MKKFLPIILLIIILNSCDLFTTRHPETPTSPRSSLSTATTPQILFQNLINSFSDKFADNYIKCFVDTLYLNKHFKFIPSSGTVSQFPILSDWNLNDERQYFNNLVIRTESKIPIQLQLKNESSNMFGDSAVYQFDYTLIIPIEAPNIPKIYQGSLKFTINLDRSNQWVITKWEDIGSANLPSWSELKGRFSN